ncbi:MAG: PepSY domain-containing protein [Campylobacterales bacterium]|nr:PepSY domain-containing protein [Campylobacterales bacterium]
MGKILHKLHLYLGLLSALILMTVATTGAILSYEKQLLALLHKESFIVEPQGSKLSVEELTSRFLMQKPDAKINAISISKAEDASYSITIASKESRKGENYYINPYNGKILPQVTTHNFFKFAENIHRRLLLGEVGKQIVGASVLILLYLLFSGVYIYMPKIKRGFVNAMKVNFKAKGRSFLYTLHGAVGLWVIPVYLTISLTGLYWSYHWYNELLHNITGIEQHKRVDMKKMGKRAQREESSIELTKIQKAFDTFNLEVKNCYKDASLRLPRTGNEYTFIYIDKKPAHPYARNKFVVDMQTMQIKEHERYDDKTFVDKVMHSIFALHSGEYFGWIGQLLFFIAALMMPLIAITGFMLYLNRRKKHIHEK